MIRRDAQSSSRRGSCITGRGATTSRILETADARPTAITLFAHGARRPKSPWRSVLMPFQPLLVSWAARRRRHADRRPRSAARPGDAAAQLLSAVLCQRTSCCRCCRRRTGTNASTMPTRRHSPDCAEIRPPRISGIRARAARGAPAIASISRAMRAAPDSRTGSVLSFEPGRVVFAVRKAGRRTPCAPRRDRRSARRVHGAQSLSAARRIFGARIAHCARGPEPREPRSHDGAPRQERDGLARRP